MRPATQVAIIAISVCICSCTNDPYRPGESKKQTYFQSFGASPSKLDPASAYYSHEGRIIDQIYEPPFTYHYLKRPYALIPQTAEAIPKAVYYGKDGKRIANPDPLPKEVHRAEYTIHIKAGISYQNHPCFAKDDEGKPYYRNATLKDIREYDHPSEFEHQGTREVKASDYALQIRRLCDPRTDSPIYSTLKQYVLGMDKLHDAIANALEEERQRRKSLSGPNYNQQMDEKKRPVVLDLMSFEFPGVIVFNDSSFKIVLKKKYPQILYWMCMHFFGPVPQEALDFYGQAVMVEKQFVLNRCPVGSGPYYLKLYDPNRLMILERNPNYHQDHYPIEGAPGDLEAGLLADAGKRIPFIHQQVYRIEKEAIPHWHKFLQGYVDSSGVADDVFDQAIDIRPGDDPTLSDAMKGKNIRLATAVETTFYYVQFNMHDDVIGGYDEKKRKLRQAISIALDYGEYLDIFENGQGVVSQGPIPPGIFGYKSGEKGTNPFVCEWDSLSKRYVRKPIEHARKLMKEAGYPDGRGRDGKQLTLFFDHSSGGRPGFRSYFDWMRRKLDQIGVRFKERGTELGRFREKRRNGTWQISSSGWLADYPDPENFLFLFFGTNGLVKYGGVNTCNYESEQFDVLFRKLETMANSDQRQTLIDEAMRVLQRDCPAIWMYHPVAYSLHHEWYNNVKPHQMSYNTKKYLRIDPVLRTRKQAAWNRPIWWPVALLCVLALALAIPATITIRRRERGH